MHLGWSMIRRGQTSFVTWEEKTPDWLSEEWKFSKFSKICPPLLNLEMGLSITGVAEYFDQCKLTNARYE